MIGIYGGTFDPPHEGHLHVASTLRKFLQLREVWWVVTKRNALKPACRDGLLQRKAQVQAMIARNKGMRLLHDLESSRTLDVVYQLFRKYPSEKFLFIAGTDVISGMHKWFRWKALGAVLPIVFLERPGYVYSEIHKQFCSTVPRIMQPDHITIREVALGWGIVRAHRNYMSSTLIRQQQEYERRRSQCDNTH